jgi:hypothetical protein
VTLSEGFFKDIIGGGRADEEVGEPRGEGLNRVVGVVFGGCVYVDDVGFLVSAETGEKCHSPIVQSLNPLGWVVIPVLYGDWCVDVTIVRLIPLRGYFTIPSCFGQLRRQLLDAGLVLLTVLGEEVSAILDSGDKPKYNLVEGVAGVGVGGGEGIESGLRGERDREGNRGGDLLKWAFGVMDSDGPTICKVTGRRRDGDGETFGGETRHLLGDIGTDEVAGEVVE